MEKSALSKISPIVALTLLALLSIVSAFGLYKALTNSNAANLVADLAAIKIAAEQHYLDTGTAPGLKSIGLDNYTTTEGFIKNKEGITGWSGPYLAYKLDEVATTSLYHTPSKSLIKAAIMPGIKWEQPSDFPEKYCENNLDKPCYLWIGFGATLSQDQKALIDTQIDGVADGENGILRYTKDGDVLLKTYPVEFDRN